MRMQNPESLAGSKTYYLACFLLAVTLCLMIAGRLTPSVALLLVMAAACGFPATFRDALARHHQQELELLQEIAETAAAIMAHNLRAAAETGAQAAGHGAELVTECQKEMHGETLGQ